MCIVLLKCSTIVQYYPHFMDEKTEAQGDITQLIGHETEIQPML